MQRGGKQNGPQVGQYDKILKENLEESLPIIIKDILRLDISHSEELPDDIQHTKYGLPIKQYVIFLMDSLPTMATAFDHEHHKYDFTLIILSSINYRVFLKSKDPKVQLLGILGNFGGEDKYTAVASILSNIEANTIGDLEKERNHNHLRIFIQLRTNIKQHYFNAMDSISNFFREERDPYYKRGVIKGKTETSEKMSHAFVKNLLVEAEFSDEQISRLAEVSIDYVQQVRAELKHK
jgi:hypothetical protein